MKELDLTRKKIFFTKKAFYYRYKKILWTKIRFSFKFSQHRLTLKRNKCFKADYSQFIRNNGFVKFVLKRDFLNLTNITTRHQPTIRNRRTSIGFNLKFSRCLLLLLLFFSFKWDPFWTTLRPHFWGAHKPRARWLQSFCSRCSWNDRSRWKHWTLTPSYGWRATSSSRCSTSGRSLSLH